jgi:hypothetical protein
MADLNIARCKTCNRPKGSYKKGRIDNQRILCIRRNDVLVVEERGDAVDQKSKIYTLLEELHDKTGKTDELQGALETVKTNLDNYSEDLGDLEPEIFEVGNCSVSDVVNELDQFRGCNSGFIPFGTIYYARTPIENGSSKEVFVVSRPPDVVRFDFAGTVYRLSVPYMNLLCTLNVNGSSYGLNTYDTFFFLTRKPLESLDQEIYRFPAHNMNSDGSYCWGSVNISVDQPKNKYVHELFSAVFGSKWNTDLRNEDTDRIPEGLGGSYSTWEERTKKKAFVSLNGDIEWTPLTQELRTFQNLLSRVIKT